MKKKEFQKLVKYVDEQYEKVREYNLEKLKKIEQQLGIRIKLKWD